MSRFPLCGDTTVSLCCLLCSCLSQSVVSSGHCESVIGAKSGMEGNQLEAEIEGLSEDQKAGDSKLIGSPARTN